MTTATGPKISKRNAKLMKAAASYVLASRSFVDFLDYVYVLDPPPGKGKTRFEKWPHLMEIADALSADRLIVVLKARQLGFSWLLAAYAVWLLLFKEGSVVLLLSKGLLESKALLRKCKYVYKHLPGQWLKAVDADAASEFSLLGSESMIIALPSTEEGGRSETATFVAQDEADFHEFLEMNFAAVKPTIDAGGQMLMGSTAKKSRLTSLFKDLFKGAPGNTWRALFMPWNARPSRDKEWYDRVRKEAPGLAKALKMDPELYMEQEYPATAPEALAPAKSMAAFNLDILKEMEKQTRSAKSTKGPHIKVYMPWRIGGRYAAGTDTSHGVGGDYAVTTMIDTVTGGVVADIMSNKLGPEELAWESLKLMALYRNPIWAIEDNEWGIITIKAVQRERYPRLYYRTTGTNKREVGWHTDERSRYMLWGDLIEAVNGRLFTVFNADGLTQFYSVIRDPDHGGRIGAMEGAHDDYPTALGIAWQVRGNATVSRPPAGERPDLLAPRLVRPERW
jgi:hypothetical protein